MNSTDRTDCPSECPLAGQSTSYALGELSTGTRAVFGVHLERCPTCRDAVRAEQALVARLRQSAATATTRDLAPSILARIPATAWALTPLDQARRAHTRRAALRGAAALLVAILGFGFWLPYQIRPQSPVTPPQQLAIDAALAWLAGAQQSNGLWTPEAWGGRGECTRAATSLALLALQRHPGKHADVIGRGIDALVEGQGDDGCLSPGSPSRMYDHAIGTLALLQRWPHAREDTALTQALDAALQYTRDQQHLDGGWGYHKTPGATPNAALTIWQLQALAQADALAWPDAEGHLRRGLRWLRRCVGPDGHMQYQSSPTPTASPALDAMAAACLAALTPRFTGLEDQRTQLAATVAAFTPESDAPDYYRDFFRARALADCPAPLARLQSDLVARQTLSSELAGTWSPDDPWSAMGGRIYTTAMAALTLDPS